MSCLPEMLNRVPPQSIEAEMSALGSMMVSVLALETGTGIVQPKHFYRPANQTILEALIGLSEKNSAIDLITLTEELRILGKLEEVGGTEYLMACVDSVPTAANVEHYCRIVEQKAILRQLIALGTEMVATASVDDGTETDKILADIESKVFSVARAQQTKDPLQTASELWKIIEDAQAGNYGVPIGLRPLAEHSVAMFPGDLILIGGRPFMGKSTLAMQLLEHVADQGRGAAMLSYEMSDLQIMMRKAARDTGINVKRMLSPNGIGDDDWSLIANSLNDSTQSKVIIEDAAGWDMRQVASRCRRLVREGVEIIGLDYLQLIEPHNERLSIREHISQVTRACKNLARSLRIPFVLLSQLSRAVESRPDARPTMADLKESGSIEADADVIYFPWHKKIPDKEARPLVTPCEIIIPKHRMLGDGCAKCGFHGQRFEFVEAPADEAEVGQAPPEWGLG